MVHCAKYNRRIITLGVHCSQNSCLPYYLLPTYIPTRLPDNLHTCLHTACLLTYYLPTYLPTYMNFVAYKRVVEVSAYPPGAVSGKEGTKKGGILSLLTLLLFLCKIVMNRRCTQRNRKCTFFSTWMGERVKDMERGTSLAREEPICLLTAIGTSGVLIVVSPWGEPGQFCPLPIQETQKVHFLRVDYLFITVRYEVAWLNTEKLLRFGPPPPLPKAAVVHICHHLGTPLNATVWPLHCVYIIHTKSIHTCTHAHAHTWLNEHFVRQEQQPPIICLLIARCLLFFLSVVNLLQRLACCTQFCVCVCVCPHTAEMWQWRVHVLWTPNCGSKV